VIRDQDDKTFVLLTPSELRLGLILTIVFMVVSSPIIIFNAALATTPSASSQPLPTISTIPSAPSTIGQDGKEGDFTTQAALSSLTARPTNNIVNTNSFYDVVFLAATSGTIKTIEVTFPAGTTIPSGAFFNEAEGIGPGTASKSGQTIIYTVTNAVNVPAGTKIRLEFANINNPLSPSANYKVTVTTRDVANAIIDGPSESTAYTIKQIGVNAIANNAITTPKIADGSITFTKPNENFMMKVELNDDAGGNAAGWNPNDATTFFTISTGEITGCGGLGLPCSFISIFVQNSAPGNVNHFCDVTRVDWFLNQFEVFCATAPDEGDSLHYLVETLPQL
jgi:hypothetical protein